MSDSIHLDGVVAHLHALDRLAATAERKARLLLLDTLACIAAGLQAPEVRRLARSYARLSPGGFRWPGCDAGLGASDAAFIGGLAACWDEACEGLARSRGQAGNSGSSSHPKRRAPAPPGEGARRLPDRRPGRLSTARFEPAPDVRLMKEN